MEWALLPLAEPRLARTIDGVLLTRVAQPMRDDSKQ